MLNFFLETLKEVGSRIDNHKDDNGIVAKKQQQTDSGCRDREEELEVSEKMMEAEDLQ
jgi:hypothetical protein